MSHKFSSTLLILASLLLLLTPSSSSAQISWLPLQFRTMDGVRPFIPVELNGKPFLFMVHANASFYAQTTHANAASAGINAQSHDADFGIDKPGHVSSLGLTKATLHTLTVGSQINHDIPLSIFEVPVPDMDGMLGIQWLRSNGVIIDYDSLRLGFTSTIDEAKLEDARFLKAGFIAHTITWDEAHHRYFITALINNKSARLVVSTVSSNIIDKAFAERAAIELGPIVYLDSGPKGAQVPNYLSKKQLMITIDGQRTAWAQPTIQDTYAYSDTPRPADDSATSAGYLGCDFMLANEAIIDFRTETLFLRPQPSAQLR